MTDLKRPGSFLGIDDEKLLKFPNAATVKLFAFDERGAGRSTPAPWRPGGRASRSRFNNLFAAGVTQRTAKFDNQLTVQLVGPDDAPAHPAILTRLSATNVTGTGPVRVRGGTNAAAAFALTGGTADDAPLPLAAALPAGIYRAAVNLWAAGAVGNVNRDFVRVALVDVERHLTGQPRIAASARTPTTSGAPTDQKRASTRTLVDRATAARARRCAGHRGRRDDRRCSAALGGGTATLVAPVLDRGAGSLNAPAFPTAVPPAALPNEVTMTALTGRRRRRQRHRGRAAGVVQTSVDPSLAGAWLRVWPQYFNSDTGRHERGAGGGGLVDSAGLVRAVVRLADGAVEPDNRMGLDLMLVTAAQAVRYPEVRLERPAPVGGTMPALSAVTDQVLACETGQTFAGPVPAGAWRRARPWWRCRRRRR